MAPIVTLNLKLKSPSSGLYVATGLQILEVDDILVP